MMQWMLKITQYADRLLEDLDTLIGRTKSKRAGKLDRQSEGARSLPTDRCRGLPKDFTTRADTLFGVT
jgi:leucyl-tRNA synthetase